MIPPFDLDAYLARIGLKERPSADVEGLMAVQRAHRLAIPFENLDIILGRGISLDPAAVFAKLVTAKRGGYCFEQNQLFLRALHALGFEARPLLARVWLFAEEVPPRTHTLNLVVIDGREWIADAGFGGSFTPPMPLEEGATITPDGVRYDLLRDPAHGWLLRRDGQDQYSFGLDEVFPTDLQMANHWTATAPGTRFTAMRIASICLPNGFAALTDRAYSRHNSGQSNSGEIESAKVYRMRLSLMFGIDLTQEEVDRLGLF